MTGSAQMAYQSCRQRASAGATASPTSPSCSRGRASSSSIARSVRAPAACRDAPPRSPPCDPPPRRSSLTQLLLPPSRLATVPRRRARSPSLTPRPCRMCTRAPLCTGEARGAPLRRRAPMPPLGDCPVHPPSGQGRIRQDPARPVVERVDLGLIRQEMCLILRENACATSGRATPGDPRGVGEHWVSSQGPRQAMRLFCFALCACSCCLRVLVWRPWGGQHATHCDGIG